MDGLNVLVILLGMVAGLFVFGRDKQPLKGRTICIDAGHGGSDPGSVGVGPLMESEINLEVAFRLEKLLISDGSNVIMTRTSKDDNPSNTQRIQISSAADMVVSIHCNGFDFPQANGTEVLYMNEIDSLLAQPVQKHLVKALGLRDRGIKQRTDLLLLNQAKVRPTIFVELGFVTNKLEAEYLAKATTQTQAAKAIIEGITEYYGGM